MKTSKYSEKLLRHQTQSIEKNANYISVNLNEYLPDRKAKILEVGSGIAMLVKFVFKILLRIGDLLIKIYYLLLYGNQWINVRQEIFLIIRR